MLEILTLLRLQSAFTGHPDISDTESAAVTAAAEALLGEDLEVKQVVLTGLLSGAGDYEGVSCKKNGLFVE